MKTTTYAAAAALLLGLTATAASAESQRWSYWGLSGVYAPGTFTPKPGCCANAPSPREIRTTRRYVYPDGRVVIVYPYKNGTGYQPFWWENQ